MISFDCQFTCKINLIWTLIYWWQRTVSQTCKAQRTHLRADEVTRQVDDRLQFEDQVPEEPLVAVLKELHLREGVDVDAQGNVCAHFLRQELQRIVFVWKTDKILLQ